MSTALVQINLNALAALGNFAGFGDASEFDSGSGAKGLPKLNIKGKEWTIALDKENKIYVPERHINVVLIASRVGKSHKFYAGTYEQGNVDAPDCHSTGGIQPDPGVSSPQAANCAVCPQAVWGSKITLSGKQGKQCQDYKLVVVVPVGDLGVNKIGPLALQVPATSLKALDTYTRNLQRAFGPGVTPSMVVTRLSFDRTQEYPSIVFEVAPDENNQPRILTPVEAQAVLELRASDDVAEAVFVPAVVSPPTPTAPVVHPSQQPVVAVVAPPSAPVISPPAPVVPQPAPTVSAAPPVSPVTDAPAAKSLNDLLAGWKKQ